MTILKFINQTVAFLLELVMLFMLGRGGYQLGRTTGWKYTLAIGLPVLAIALWSYWAAPKSIHRLAFPYLTLFKLSLFGCTAYQWYKAGHQTSAVSFIGIVLLSEFTAVVLKQ